MARTNRVVPSSVTQGPTTQRGLGRSRHPYAAPPAGPLSQAHPAPDPIPTNLLPFASQAMLAAEDWVPDTNVTSADATFAVALDGASSLAVVVSVAEGTVRWPNAGTSGVAVAAGDVLTIVASVRCDTDSSWYVVARGLAWTSGGAGVAVSGQTVVDPIGQSVWQTVTHTYTVPATAVYAGISLSFGNIANGTTVCVDRVGLFRGNHGEDVFNYSGGSEAGADAVVVTPTVAAEATVVRVASATAVTVTPTVTAAAGKVQTAAATTVSVTPSTAATATVVKDGSATTLTVTPSTSGNANRTAVAIVSAISVTPTVAGSATGVRPTTASTLSVTPAVTATASGAQAATANLTVTPVVAGDVDAVRVATADVAVTPTVAADGSKSGLVQTASAETLLVTPVTDASAVSWSIRFTTGTRRVRETWPNEGWNFSILSGVTLLQTAPSVWKETEVPTQDELASAVTAYRGGYVYQLTDDEADALATAGYGAGITAPGRFLDVFTDEF